MRSILKRLSGRHTTAVAYLARGMTAQRTLRRAPMISRTLAIALAAVAALGALGAARADAAINCTHSVPGLLEVYTRAHGDAAFVSTAGGAINVRGQLGAVTCAGAPATTTSIDTILVVDESDNFATPAGNDGNSYVQITEPASFRPGKTPESEYDEIEFLMDPKAGEDTLAMGGEARQILIAGNDGVSWTLDSDADVLGIPFDSLGLYGGPLIDDLTAQGAYGTGAPLSTVKRVTLSGGDGPDRLSGSDGPAGDQLDGGAGPDSLFGRGGPDELEPGPGDDSVVGGLGQDAADFVDASAAVRVDLADAQPQDTGEGIDVLSAIENVIGSEYADTLFGDAGVNVFDGDNGDDMLEGRGGADELRGGGGSDTASYASAPAAVTADLSQTTQPGEGDRFFSIESLVGSPFADTLTGNLVGNRIDGGAGADVVAAGAGPDAVQVRDGEGDRIRCGEDADTAISDRRSLDALDADCEGVDALPEPAGGGGTGGQDPLPTGGDTALSFTLWAARTQRVLRQRGIRMRLSSPDEASTVTVTATAVLRRGGRPIRLRLKPLTATAAAGTARGVRLALTRKQRGALAAAMRGGQQPVFKLTARARDAAANTVIRALRVRSVR